MSRSRTPPQANTQLPPRAPPAWVRAGPPAHLSFSHSPPLCNNASHHYILTWRAEILRNHISGWLLWQGGGNLKVACRLPVPLVNIPLPLQQPRFWLPCSRSHTLRPRSWPSLLLCKLGYQFSHLLLNCYMFYIFQRCAPIYSDLYYVSFVTNNNKRFWFWCLCNCIQMTLVQNDMSTLQSVWHNDCRHVWWSMIMAVLIVNGGRNLHRWDFRHIRSLDLYNMGIAARCRQEARIQEFPRQSFY